MGQPWAELGAEAQAWEAAGAAEGTEGWGKVGVVLDWAAAVWGRVERLGWRLDMICLGRGREQQRD